MKMLIALSLSLAVASQDAAPTDLSNAGLAEKKNDWRGALALYRKHLLSPVTRDEATLGELRCLTALSDLAGLKRRSLEILSSTQAKPPFSARVLIAATTARGDVETGAGQVKEALLDYLRGAWVLAPGETSREHETALARSSLTCAKLAAAQSDPRRYRSRARELLADLDQAYPQSAFKKEIELALR